MSQKITWESPTNTEALNEIKASIGLRADKVLSHFLQIQNPELSRARIQHLFEAGQIQCNNELVYSVTSSVQLNQKWVVDLPPPKALTLVPADLPLTILYEDEHLAVVVKPAGLVTHPSPTVTGPTLVEVLLARLNSLSQIGGVERPGIVHRLDQWTSGVMVISKTDICHQSLQLLFSKHDIERRYWALVYGRLPQARVTIKSLIGRHPRDRIRMTTQVDPGPSVRDAITHFEEKEVYKIDGKVVASWVEAKLETGRTHQVRVHLEKLGCSVLADPLYGVPKENNQKWRLLPSNIQTSIENEPGQILHAWLLGFAHPILKNDLRFTAEFDERFERIRSLFRSL